MRSLKFYLICSLLIVFFSCKKTDSNTFPTEENVKLIMNKEMKKSDLPAVVAIAVNKNGEKVIFEYGKAIWTEDVELTSDHIFRIYSMTKLITSIAALQLVEKGMIGLDDDLSALMPEMAEIPIIANGKLETPSNKITLRHLLTHTSGFGYSGFTVSDEGYDKENWDFEDAPRHFESGTEFLYGSSIDWAGKVVEKLSGMDLEAYFREHITKPLGMNRTFFNVPDSLQAYIVSHGSHGEDGKDGLKELPNRIPTQKQTTLSGGGGLFSTPSDYTKLLHCLLIEGKYKGGRILSKETIDEMIQNQVGDISLDPKDRLYNPGWCCNFNGLMSENSKWGLAFMIDNNPKPYGRQAGTVLWGGLFNTYFYIDFKSGIAASMYSQHIPFNHIQTTSLFERFSEIIYLKQ